MWWQNKAAVCHNMKFASIKHLLFMWWSGGCTFWIFTTQLSETTANLSCSVYNVVTQVQFNKQSSDHMMSVFLFLFKGTFQEKRKCLRSKLWHVQIDVRRRLHDSFNFVWKLGLILEWPHFLTNTLCICYFEPSAFVYVTQIASVFCSFW